MTGGGQGGAAVPPRRAVLGGLAAAAAALAGGRRRAAAGADTPLAPWRAGAGPDRALDIAGPEALEAAARRVLSPDLADWIAGGAGAEETLRRNRAAFARVAILPRVLTGVERPDLGLALFGARLGMPVLVAPFGLHGLLHPRAEAATAAGAAAAGTVFTAATVATLSLEETARAAPDGPRWFQLYPNRDRGLTLDLLRRAEAAGYGAVVLTVDAPAAVVRERDLANRFALPAEFGAGNLLPAYGPGATLLAGTDAGFAWRDVEALRAATRLPLMLKGILAPEDAVEAVRRGANAILVSNHGGRILDGAPAGLDLLPRVAEAVAGAAPPGRRVPLLLDGGIRRGADVFKALALGAEAVAVGRPACWALALGGAAGVRSVLERLAAELAATMHLAGCARLADITPRFVLRGAD